MIPDRRALVPVLECVPNVSEGRDRAVVARIAEAVRGVPGARLVDVHADADHHRSVFTFLGPPDGVERAALALAEAVLEAVDMRHHRGVHPRIGALDVLPFIPLRGLSMDDAVAVAHRVGEALGRIHDLPVYFYGAAARSPERRALPAVRLGQYEGLREKAGDPAWRPDAGPASFRPRSGASAVGARGILVAFNVWLRSGDVEAARAIAHVVRESSGGLPAVQAMGVRLASRGLVQVSMNLLDYRLTPIPAAFEAMASEAARRGIAVQRCELVGLAPRAAFAGRPPEGSGLADLGPENYLDTYVALDGEA
jgi:glutamate formiminotransferase